MTAKNLVSVAAGSEARQARFVSHALVEVRRFRVLPFFVRSAVLLDVSLGGFKAEFTGEQQAKPGEQYWLNIPLIPLGIYAPTNIMVKAEVRWFDQTRYRIGGVFMHLSQTDRMIIEQVISSLNSKDTLG